jgi:hypothetical protein
MFFFKQHVFSNIIYVLFPYFVFWNGA